MLKEVWNTIFVDTFYKVEAEKSTGIHLDKKAITILFVVAFSLLFMSRPKIAIH